MRSKGPRRGEGGADAKAPPAAPAWAVGAIDHVQLAMPPGGEPRARAFYEGVIGLAETPKPPDLAGRGGCWFEGGGVRLHLGVDPGFRAAKKAHIALAVAPLELFLSHAAAAGVPVERVVHQGGLRQAYLEDPFGNRIEIVDGEAAPPQI